MIALTNLLLLMLFARIFVRADSPECFFNPIVLAVGNVTDRIVAFAAPLFPGMRRRFVICIALVFLIVFRSAVIASVPSLDWSVVVGSTLRFAPRGGWASTLAFGFFHFIAFLADFWGMWLFASFVSPNGATSRVGQAVEIYSRPVSLLPRWQALVAVIAIKALCVYALVNFTVGTLGAGAAHSLASAFDVSTALRRALMYVGITFFSVCDVLSFVREVLVVTIFASLLAAILQRRSWAMFFMEFQNTLLGSFSRRRLSVGVFDFAPVVFFIALNIIYGILIFLATMALKYAGVIAAGALAIQTY